MGTNSLSLEATTLPLTCAIGDLRTDANASYKLKQCGVGNVWSEISGTGDAVSLRGRAVATTAPTNAYVLTWNNSASQWEPQPAVSPLPTFTNTRVLFGDGTNTPATSALLTYVSGTGALTATSFIGALTGNVTGNVSGSSGSTTGNAATVTTNANLTGPITSVGNATSVASQTGTGTKFVMDTSPTLVTPALGTPTALVGTNITGTAAGLTAGNVTTNANLTGDVTSVGNATTIGATKVTNAMLAGSIAASKLIGSDIATVGTITSGTWNGTAVDAAHGGTGQSSYAVGDILYASASNVLSKLSGTVYGSVLKFIGGLPAWVYPNNFILNDSATADTTGWATYADAAGTSPVDCTGGSPSSTWTRTTSNPLSRDGGSFLFTHSANNRQGEGFSYAFNVDRASSIAPKVQKIEFDYEVASGTFQTGSTSTDSDIEWWIVDTTSGALIQPSTYKIYSQAGKFLATFQNNVSSASYRICGHVATTNAVAFTFKAANFRIWPSNYTYGTPFTDPVSVTMTTGGWVDANHTTTALEHHEGKYANYDVLIAITGAPTSATLTVNLPSGRTVDTSAVTKSGANSVEVEGSNCLIVAAGGAAVGKVVYNNTTSVSIYSETISTFSGTQPGRYTAVTQASPATFTNGDWIRCTFRLPILGWSSGVQMSDSAPQSLVSFQATDAAAQTLTTATWTQITGWTTVKDSAGGFASNAYVVKTQGDYLNTGALDFAPNATGFRGARIKKNGTVVYEMTVANATVANQTSVPISILLTDLKSGDSITIEGYQNSGGNLTAGTNANYSQWNIVRQASPQTIGATETISAEVYNTATPSFVTNVTQTLTYNSTIYDDHGWMNLGTGVYTVHSPGLWEACGKYDGSNSVANALYDYFLNVGNVAFSSRSVGAIASGLVTVPPLCISNKLKDGDTIFAQARCTFGSGTCALNSGLGTSSHLNIRRVGN